MRRKNKYRDYSTFNIIEMLDDYGISYKSSGKNIGSGWIGVEICPFCSGGGFHFGVHARNKAGNCWICGETTGAVNLVKELLGCTIKEAYGIINQYDSENTDWIPEEDVTGEHVIFPDNLVKGLTPDARKYLTQRGFYPDILEKQFKLRTAEYGSTLHLDSREWDFSQRIIAPVFMNRKIQCYVARDYTGQQEPKYMNAPKVASIISPHETIYNYDTLIGKIIIVEGITDVWRLGAKSCAFLGITFTKAQIRLLLQRDISEATILFDKGAEKRAKELARILASIINNVKVAYLEKDDPGSLSQDQAMKVKYQLIGEI